MECANESDFASFINSLTSPYSCVSLLKFPLVAFMLKFPRLVNSRFSDILSRFF